MVRVSYAHPYPPGACEAPHQPCLQKSSTSTQQAWFQCLALWPGDSTHTVHCMATCCSACQCGCQWQFQHPKAPTHVQNHGEVVDTPLSCPAAHAIGCPTPKHCHVCNVYCAGGFKRNNHRQQQMQGIRSPHSWIANLRSAPGYSAATLQARREGCFFILAFKTHVLSRTVHRQARNGNLRQLAAADQSMAPKVSLNSTASSCCSNRLNL
jgi:hypothetical protein